MRSASALEALMEPPRTDGHESGAENDDIGIEEGAGTPLVVTASMSGKLGGRKPSAGKRVYFRGDRGQITMRCGSIHESLETSRKGLVRSCVSVTARQFLPPILARP